MTHQQRLKAYFQYGHDCSHRLPETLSGSFKCPNHVERITPLLYATEFFTNLTKDEDFARSIFIDDCQGLHGIPRDICSITENRTYVHYFIKLATKACYNEEKYTRSISLSYRQVFTTTNEKMKMNHADIKIISKTKTLDNSCRKWCELPSWKFLKGCGIHGFDMQLCSRSCQLVSKNDICNGLFDCSDRQINLVRINYPSVM